MVQNALVPTPGPENTGRPVAATHRRGGLFRKNVVLFACLVGGILIASGSIEGYLSFQDHRAHVIAIQQERASTAAAKIEAFVGEVEHLLTAMVRTPRLADVVSAEQHHGDYLLLLRQSPAILELTYVSAGGREQVRVSRIGLDTARSDIDHAQDARFVQARRNGISYSRVSFRSDSEPFMSVSLADSGSNPGVTIADVNLKFIWEVVSRMQVGHGGRAYVVDRDGNLIADPDISLVLRRTNLSTLPQVAAARRTPARSEEAGQAAVARDTQGQAVLAAYDTIDPLGWIVFVEEPLAEAIAPLYGFLLRSAALVLIALVLTIAVSMVLAQRIARPIRALQAGAAAIAEGALDQRIAVWTGDEIEDLAEQFNAMSAELRGSYSLLEQRVAQRTQELADLNQTLEDRVRLQVDELERVGRLRRYLAPQLADLIVSSGDESMLRSHRRQITVVFGDLRGFTSFAEAAEPEEVMEILGEYHDALGEAIRRFEGTIAFFAGDGVMVFFNDPAPQPDHADRAVRMAVLLRERMGVLSHSWRRRGHALGFGTGIALGYATIGRIGFDGRFDYTAIGSVANLAARLCAEAANGQILISSSVQGVLEDRIETEELGFLALKGFQHPIPALNVLAIQDVSAGAAE